MIGRIWHGWTTRADAYERLLRREIFPGIAACQVPGGEDEFITIMWFASSEAVKRFAGEDYERAVVPPKAQALLARFDDRAQHYDIREQRQY